jgi:hypothetical protein
MRTFWNTKFTKRDPECTTIVAIKAEVLPKRYDAAIWKANGQEVKAGIELQYLGATYENGQRYELYGYL